MGSNWCWAGGTFDTYLVYIAEGVIMFARDQAEALFPNVGECSAHQHVPPEGYRFYVLKVQYINIRSMLQMHTTQRGRMHRSHNHPICNRPRITWLGVNIAVTLGSVRGNHVWFFGGWGEWLEFCYHLPIKVNFVFPQCRVTVTILRYGMVKYFPP